MQLGLCKTTGGYLLKVENRVFGLSRSELHLIKQFLEEKGF
jgi:hypothetical protein